MNEVSKKVKPIQFKVVPRLLDHIGLGMYSKFDKAIGELVVNGYDADATKVDIHIKPETITIVDNGSGMSEKDIREEYMMLGSGHKRKVQRTKKHNRLPIGNKGIGKLAGLGIAKRMQIITSREGRKYTYYIDREEMDNIKTLDEAFHDLSVSKADNKETGTTIILTKLLKNVKIDVPGLRGHLAREIPQDKTFAIIVDGQKCQTRDIPAKRRIPVNIDDKICGKIIGEVIIAKKALTIVEPGIITTVRGRAVGAPSLFDLTKTAHRFYYIMSALITGAVEVTDFDPEGKEEDIPVIKTDREGFNEEHPKYRQYRKIMTDLLKRICQEEEKELDKKKNLEIEAKVQDAMKNITEDFNAYNKEQQQMKKEQRKKADIDESGKERIFTETDELLKQTKDKSKQKKANPIGITDKHLRDELRAMSGYGSINLGNKRYKVTLKPLGEDDYECRIDDEALVININISHPAYDQAVAERAVELVVFRAIAAAWVWKESQTSQEFYEKLDDMIRYQAFRMQGRRSKKRRSSRFLLAED